MPKFKQNDGWILTTRKDSSIGRMRAIAILYKNGKEIKHHWMPAEDYTVMPSKHEAILRQLEGK